MKKQLLGIFLGLSILEGVSIVHADDHPIVHFDADDYLDYSELDNNDRDGSSPFRPNYPRIKRSKRLSPEQRAIERKIKNQISNVLRSFAVKDQPLFRQLFKEALRNINNELYDNVNEVGFDARTYSPEKRQQMLDNFAQNYKGKLGVRSLSGLEPKKARSALDAGRALSDKDVSAEGGSVQGIAGLSSGQKVADFAHKALQKGKFGVEKGVETIKDAWKYLTRKDAANNINLLDDESIDAAQNGASNERMSQRDEGTSQAHEEWRDILEGYLSRTNRSQKKVEIAIQELEKTFKRLELSNPDDVRNFVEDVRNFVRTLKDTKRITEAVYNKFLKKFNTLKSIGHHPISVDNSLLANDLMSLDNSVSVENNTRTKKKSISDPVKENTSGPAYNTRSKN